MSDDEGSLILHPGFLATIDNPDIQWSMTLMDGSIHVVRIINYKNTARGVPITLYVLCAGDHYEIPWTAIQTIRKVVNDERS